MTLSGANVTAATFNESQFRSAVGQSLGVPPSDVDVVSVEDVQGARLLRQLCVRFYSADHSRVLGSVRANLFRKSA
jgi:hypothetical protein